MTRSNSIYYNENDTFAAEWLRILIKEKLLPEGDVDDRSIADVRPVDLRGYQQCHFFAGIGGWAYAIQLANWGERSVWTGSCPCQPFSTAGKRKGFADERHLWPVWFDLIRECRPPTIFGEQVANGSAAWLDTVSSDLEGQDFAFGAADLPAVSVGAPHIRSRTFFVAHSHKQRQHDGGIDAKVAALSDPLAHSGSTRLSAPRSISFGTNGREAGRVFAAGGWWGVEPDVGRVAHGVSHRVGLLRGLGNAIVPQVAAAFVSAFLLTE